MFRPAAAGTDAAPIGERVWPTLKAQKWVASPGMPAMELTKNPQQSNHCSATWK